jgi:hypothetical protein
VWITHSIVPPQQLHDTLRKIFSIDTNKFPPGLPLRIKMADDAGKRELIYDTVNAQKQMIHTASFTYPPTYKRVDSELAVLMDEKSRKKMESILDDSDDLSSILGSTSTPSRSSYKSSYSSASGSQFGVRPTTSNGYRPAAGSTPGAGTRSTATTSATTAKKDAQGGGDWWTNMFRTLGGGK